MSAVDNLEIRYLGDLQRLELKPGDRFVLMVPQPITSDIAARIQDAWKDFVGGDSDKLKLLILTDGMRIGAISTSEPAA